MNALLDSLAIAISDSSSKFDRVLRKDNIAKDGEDCQKDDSDQSALLASICTVNERIVELIDNVEYFNNRCDLI